jgi:hypothetical protein
VLLAEDETGRISGSGTIGHDGHRGGRYYVASANHSRGCGIVCEIVRAAEQWPSDRGVCKAQLLVRETNYEHVGYDVVPRVIMSKWLKLAPDPEALLKLLYRWRDEAVKAGRKIKRIVVAYEAGREGFWLARWRRARQIETYVLHPTSVAASREHRPLDTWSSRALPTRVVGAGERKAWRKR